TSGKAISSAPARDAAVIASSALDRLDSRSTDAQSWARAIRTRLSFRPFLEGPGEGEAGYLGAVRHAAHAFQTRRGGLSRAQRLRDGGARLRAVLAGEGGHGRGLLLEARLHVD